MRRPRRQIPSSTSDQDPSSSAYSGTVSQLGLGRQIIVDLYGLSTFMDSPQ